MKFYYNMDGSGFPDPLNTERHPQYFKLQTSLTKNSLDRGLLYLGVR